jgi:inhibitor of KinA
LRRGADRACDGCALSDERGSGHVAARSRGVVQLFCSATECGGAFLFVPATGIGMLRTMTFAPLGDSAVVVTLGSSINEAALLRVRSLTAALERERANGIVDVVPAYTTVAVFYDLGLFGGGDESPYERVCRTIATRAAKAEDVMEREARREIEIPVCYGGAFGPDLEEVARHGNISPEEVIALHSGASYVVHAVGFTPGFPYLGGLPEKLHTPRRATPRQQVPAGSVGIGGMQTGIYPIASPGGWQLIGRTPLTLFRLNEKPPALLSVSDRIKFRAITAEEFAAWK